MRWILLFENWMLFLGILKWDHLKKQKCRKASIGYFNAIQRLENFFSDLDWSEDWNYETEGKGNYSTNSPIHIEKIMTEMENILVLM